MGVDTRTRTHGQVQRGSQERYHHGERSEPGGQKSARRRGSGLGRCGGAVPPGAVPQRWPHPAISLAAGPAGAFHLSAPCRVIIPRGPPPASHDPDRVVLNPRSYEARDSRPLRTKGPSPNGRVCWCIHPSAEAGAVRVLVTAAQGGGVVYPASLSCGCPAALPPTDCRPLHLLLCSTGRRVGTQRAGMLRNKAPQSHAHNARPILDGWL